MGTAPVIMARSQNSDNWNSSTSKISKLPICEVKTQSLVNTQTAIQHNDGNALPNGMFLSDVSSFVITCSRCRLFHRMCKYYLMKQFLDNPFLLHCDRDVLVANRSGSYIHCTKRVHHLVYSFQPC